MRWHFQLYAYFLISKPNKLLTIYIITCQKGILCLTIAPRESHIYNFSRCKHHFLPWRHSEFLKSLQYYATLTIITSWIAVNVHNMPIDQSSFRLDLSIGQNFYMRKKRCICFIDFAYLAQTTTASATRLLNCDRNIFLDFV